MVTLYTDIPFNNKSFYRIFTDISPNKLIWHRDKQDRIIKLLSTEEVFLQYENELPLKMMINVPYVITKQKYHRILIKNQIHKLVFFIYEPNL